jgi:hypothetical protein
MFPSHDRGGKLEDRPKRIKAEIFPYRELPDLNGYLTELAQLGFIDRYQVGETSIIKVLNFSKHQSPHKTEKASELPDKPLKTDSCPITVNAPLNNESETVKESLIPDSGFLIPDSKPKAKRFTAPTQNEVYEYMVERDYNSKTEAEKFIDFYSSKGWMVGKTKMVDWKAAVRNWLKGAEKLPEPTASDQQRVRVLDRYRQDLEKLKT